MPAPRKAVSTVAPDPVRALARLRKRLGWERGLCARLLRTSESSLADWESRRKPMPRAAQRCLRHAERVYDQGTRVLQRDYIGEWLQVHVPAFDGLTPLDLIERGDHDRVWGALYGIEYGAYV